MYRIIDHTADVGLECEAPSLEELFRELMKGLLALMFDSPPSAGEVTQEMQVEAGDLEALCVRWMDELVYWIQTRQFVPVDGQIKIETTEDGYRLTATLQGTDLDLEAFGWQGEIKSATFHGLRVEQRDADFFARIILDV